MVRFIILWGCNTELWITSHRVDGLPAVSLKSKMGVSVAVVSVVSPCQEITTQNVMDGMWITKAAYVQVNVLPNCLYGFLITLKKDNVAEKMVNAQCLLDAYLHMHINIANLGLLGSSDFLMEHLRVMERNISSHSTGQIQENTTDPHFQFSLCIFAFYWQETQKSCRNIDPGPTATLH